MSRPTSENQGCIELICGCMFSGKTEQLLTRLAEARKRSLPAVAFKHVSDDRYSPGHLVTHSGARAEAIPLASAQRILELAGDARLVAIDEAQFFDPGLVDVCRQLAAQGRDVLVAGLDRDSWGEPFGPVPTIEAIADRVTRTWAACSVCGQPAEYTQRCAPIDGREMVGGAGQYEPRCGRCFQAPPIELRR